MCWFTVFSVGYLSVIMMCIAFYGTLARSGFDTANSLSQQTHCVQPCQLVSVALTEYHRMVTSQHANDSPHVHVGDNPSLCFGYVHVSPLPSTSPDSLTSTWSHADNLLSCISGKHVPCIHILAETSNPERPRSWYRICSTSYYDVMIVAQADSMHSQL